MIIEIAMIPWALIGYSITGFACWLLLKRALSMLTRWLSIEIAHWRTRNIPPREGQVWVQGDSFLRIGPRYRAGHFSIHTGTRTCGSSWGETDEEWKQRVKNRKLYLYLDAPAATIPGNTPGNPHSGSGKKPE